KEDCKGIKQMQPYKLLRSGLFRLFTRSADNDKQLISVVVAPTAVWYSMTCTDRQFASHLACTLYAASSFKSEQSMIDLYDGGVLSKVFCVFRARH
ncbi:hypothetical protein J6590_087528, partial [Homalodisca vitripennis]